MKPTLYKLKDADGHLLRNRYGEPFEYTTEELAKIGRRVLAKHLEKPVFIVEP